MAVALRLAEFLTATTAADLPPRALDHAAMLIASTVASAACGTGLESARIIRDLARDPGGRPEATLWFAGDRLPAAHTAQVNAVMSDAAASDDSDLRNIVHAGTPLTAASLAIAERSRAQSKKQADRNRRHPWQTDWSFMTSTARSASSPSIGQTSSTRSAPNCNTR